MKKLSVCIIGIFLSLTFVLSACGERHVHNYTVISVSSPDCSSYGTRIVLCLECGDKSYQRIAPSGHDYSEQIISPSCETEGYTLYTCKNCGDSYTDDFVSTLGHSFVIEKTEATCQKDGSICEICKRCGFINSEDIIAATEHVFNEMFVSATCESEGYTAYECEICGYSYNDDYVSKTSHNYILTERRDVVGNSDGYEIYTCVYCGKYYEKILSGSEHDYSEKIVLDSSCTADGMKAFYCIDCGKSYTETIPALGHDYLSSVLVESNCMAEGVIEYKCSRCSSLYIKQLPKASHNFGEWQKAMDPTSESEGRLRRYCVTPGCTNYEYFTLPPLSDKDYVCGVLLEPTFEYYGAAYYIYEKDGQYFSFEEPIQRLESDLIYEFNKQNDTCVVTGIKNAGLEIVVPAYYGKFKVVEIRSFAFYGIQTEKVTVHAVKICDDAFRNCSLKEVVIGDEVTDIGKNAFAGCNFLMKACFPQKGNWIANSVEGDVLLSIDDENECAVYLTNKYLYYNLKRY